MKKAISKVIQEAAEITDVDSRVDYLIKNQNEPMKELLKLAVSKNVEWDLPEGAPPYKPSSYLDQEGMLYHETRRLYLFLKSGNTNLTKIKREMLYINLLESLHPGDAELLIAVKDKKLPKTLNKKVINKAFPGLVED